MVRKRYTTKKIIGYLRQAEVMIGQGQSMDTVLRELGVTNTIYYRWPRLYGRYGYKRITSLLRTSGLDC